MTDPSIIAKKKSPERKRETKVQREGENPLEYCLESKVLSQTLPKTFEINNAQKLLRGDYQDSLSNS